MHSRLTSQKILYSILVKVACATATSLTYSTVLFWAFLIKVSKLQGSIMFSDSQGFTVNGGTFTNITHHHAASVPSIGDIDLWHEIRVDGDTGIVERAAVRRVYSAQVEGRKSKFMVAIYQGDGAKEEWRRNIAKYTAIRQVSCTFRSSAPELYTQPSQYRSDLWGICSDLTDIRSSKESTVWEHKISSSS
ncbi:hypothetical protein B0H14DRAFT_2568448 [Mycena olivaceomarginata]|nr:hypothetical protein B0H14DRAFT_2568448 [Mycena olivaceomarginata]